MYCCHNKSRYAIRCSSLCTNISSTPFLCTCNIAYHLFGKNIGIFLIQIFHSPLPKAENAVTEVMEGVNDDVPQYSNSSIKAIAQLASSEKVGKMLIIGILLQRNLFIAFWDDGPNQSIPRESKR